MLYDKGRTILVRAHYEAAVQEEYFFLDEHGRLDLSEIGLLVGTPIYEAGIQFLIISFNLFILIHLI